MYSEEVLEHFVNPKNVGEITDADAYATVGNSKCGQVMKIYMNVKNNIITDIKYNTLGCGSSIAVMSLLSNMLLGKSIDEANTIINASEESEIGSLINHCGVLAKDAVNEVINNYKQKNSQM